MGRKYALRIVLNLVLIGVLLLASNAALAGLSAKGLSSGTADADPPLLSSRLFFQQNFDNETVGSSANAWTVLPGTAGSLTVDNTVDYLAKGPNSAKFIDNSNTSSVVAFRYFYPRNDTIVFSFSLYFLNNTVNTTGLEVSVDDGVFNGANIIFKDGLIQYYDGHDGLVTLQHPFVTNKWYRIMFIMNIPSNKYNIHIDDHLEILRASFNGSCNQIQRIAITQYYPPGSRNVVGYIDDIIGFGAITIPTDFPTIQAGIDAASPGDVIYVTGPRVYFENVVIPAKKNSVWLVGQDMNTVIIDGRFAPTVPNRIFLNGCSNVTVYGFTINMSSENGAQVSVTGSGNTIAENIIVNGLGDGIRVAGSNMTIIDNVIQLNEFGIGINLFSGQGNLVYNNTIARNMVGLECGKNAFSNLIFGNRFVANKQQAIDNGASNMWNDGYPYVPQNMTGGGNYWSDLTNCTDVYSGPNQDQTVNCCFPSPDGICDQPYMINLTGIDHYPLFLIQNVTQDRNLNHANCALKVFDKSVDYTMDVTVTVQTLKFVKILNASLFVEYTNASGTSHVRIQLSMNGNTLTGVIPHHPYNTTVRYNVSAIADGADWLNSTNYPIPFPYLVDDMTPPVISPSVNFIPYPPDASQFVNVIATVTEPADASGVDKVYVSYLVNSTVWTARMTNIGGGQYAAVVPWQPGGITLNVNITAIDKAGNAAGPNSNSTYVQKLAQLLVSSTNPIPFDPCSVDLGILSGDQTYSAGFNITNLSGSNDDSLSWNITIVKGGLWFSIRNLDDPLNPTSGILAGGQIAHLIVTIDTRKCTDPGLYVAELSVNANGTVLQWAVVVTFTVRDIIIDMSWASSEWPNRVNVFSTQAVAFHAEWAINCLDATGGALQLSGSTDFVAVNATGWASFTLPNKGNPANTTYRVSAVKFGNITSFWQTAPSRTVTWDKVKIVLSMVNNYVDVDSAANISWNGSHYELDNRPFKGFVIFNDSLTRDHVEEASITASQIINYESNANPMLNVTVFESNSVDVIWDEIRIIQGGVSSTNAGSGQTEHVWFIAIYEGENTLFKGENGTMLLNVTLGPNTSKVPLDWSFDDIWNWRKDFNYSSGTVTFQVCEVHDYVHHLTKIKDGVGPLNITWGEIVRPWWEAWLPTTSNSTVASQSDPAPSAQIVQTGSSNVYIELAIIMAVIVITGLVLTLLLLMGSGKKSKSSTAKKKSSYANQKIETSTSKS